MVPREINKGGGGEREGAPPRGPGACPAERCACSRHPPAFAPTSLRLSGAAEAQRCYDFQCQELIADFLGLHDVFSPRCIGRGGASKRRRLILLLSVGWVPPYLRPSGACLCLGSSVLSKPPNAAEGYTTPGLRLFPCTLAPFRVELVYVMRAIKSRRGLTRRSAPP